MAYSHRLEQGDDAARVLGQSQCGIGRRLADVCLWTHQLSGNFHAHRCHDTADKARAVGRRQFIALAHPTDILLASAATSRVSVLVDWIDDLYSAVDLTS